MQIVPSERMWIVPRVNIVKADWCSKPSVSTAFDGNNSWNPALSSSKLIPAQKAGSFEVVTAEPHVTASPSSQYTNHCIAV